MSQMQHTPTRINTLRNMCACTPTAFNRSIDATLTQRTSNTLQHTAHQQFSIMTSIRLITPRASNTFSTALSPGSPKTNASGVNETHFPPFAVSLATQPGSVLGKLAEFAPFKALPGGLNKGWRECVCVIDDVEVVRDEACIMVGDESRGDKYVRGRTCALLGVCGCVRVCVCVHFGDLGRAGGGEGRRFRSCDFVGVFFFSRGGVRRKGATARESAHEDSKCERLHEREMRMRRAQRENVEKENVRRKRAR